jgi:hypothetical protein
LDGPECGGKKVAAMFSLAAAASPISPGDSVEFINDGTACLNSISVSASSAEKKAAAGEVHRFIDPRVAADGSTEAYVGAGELRFVDSNGQTLLLKRHRRVRFAAPARR